MPTTIDDTITTPYEAVYKSRPDYRTLIPMFAISYIKQARDNGQDKTSWTSKTLKCILIGSCSKSDGLLFYHPPSKQILTCGDGFRFDLHSPAGPHFAQHYEGDFILTTKSARETIHIAPQHETNAEAFYKDENDKYLPVRILDVPIDEHVHPYTVQHIETGDIIQVMYHDLLDHDPSANPQLLQNTQKIPFPQYPWIANDAKVTLYLQHIMPRPKQGYLHHNTDTNTWSFISGQKKKGETLPLPNFPLLVDSMIANKTISKGWINAASVIAARRVIATANLVAGLIVNKKESAANLYKK